MKTKSFTRVIIEMLLTVIAAVGITCALVKATGDNDYLFWLLLLTVKL